MSWSRFTAILAVVGCVAAHAQQVGDLSKGVKAVPSSAASFLAETKQALVIGVNQYAEGSDLPNLKWAKKDAEDLAKALTDQGYKTELLTDQNAIKTTIRRKLKDMVARVEPGKGTIVFAFSGHGAGSPEKKDEQGRVVRPEGQYLLTAESAVETIDETGLDIQEVERDLKGSRAARKIDRKSV